VTDRTRVEKLNERAQDAAVRLRPLAGRMRRRAGRLARRAGLRPSVAPPTGAPAGAAAPPAREIRVLRTLDELDGKLREIDAAGAVSDDAMREVFQTFKMGTPTDLPSDPASAEYADRQFEMYRRISGRTEYAIANERSDYAVDANRPFPYYTESFDTVGHQLMAFGFIIRTMALPAGASVLELGAGWGNTTVALARMGYQVTSVDVDPNFVDLVRERGTKFGLSIDARQGEFLQVDQLGLTFDAVLFYESFHHCSDHRSLLERLGKVLNPGGRVFFASEPIDDSFPIPWGLRLDGESLWAIRANGWLELGFQESYFVRMLLHLGWVVAEKHVTPATHLGVIYEARQADGVYEMSTFRLPPDEDATWAPSDGNPDLHQRYTARRSVLSVARGLGCRSIAIEAVNASPREIPYRIEHGRHVTSGVAAPNGMATIEVPYDPAGEHLVISASTWRPRDLLKSLDGRQLGLGIRTIRLH
jgi:2-polyprenyl-3-methyl-5-hydroxy-6-metoxy-1,4-benzoquinol methylase